MTEATDYDAFAHALDRFPDGYAQGTFEGRPWAVTLKRSADRKRVWFYAEERGAKDIVSFNMYRLQDSGPALKPCEMSSEKVVAFVLGFDMVPTSAGGP